VRPSILFLDDDPVIRVVRLVLSNAEDDPWIGDYFAPEHVDVSRLTRAARGLRRSDGMATTPSQCPAHPPAIAGMTVTSSPSCTGAPKPPRKRMSSSFT